MGLLDLFRKKELIPETVFIPSKDAKGDWTGFESKLLQKSLIMLVVGKRGSGKTSLGFRMLELFHWKTKKRCFALGYERVRLPSWIKKVEAVEQARMNSVVLIDEGALAFSAREPMHDVNKAIGKIMAVARHRALTLIFISQSSAMIDVNVLRLVDVLLLKEPSLLQAKFERKALREIYDDVRDSFKELEHPEQHVYVYDDDFQGLVQYGLPLFWKDDVSRSYKNA